MRNIRRGNFERLRIELSHLSLPASGPVDDAWSHLKNQLLTHQTNFIPNCEEKKNINNKNHPWFNIAIKRALKARDNLHTRMKTRCSTENIRLYNEARQRVKTLIKQTKRHNEDDISPDSKNNTKKFFEYINSKKKKHIRTGIGPLIDNAGNLVTDDQNMANMLNGYFSSVFNAPTETGHITTNDTDTNNEIGSTPATSSEHPLHNLEITTEVLKALSVCRRIKIQALIMSIPGF